MTGDERKKRILEILGKRSKPISGLMLAKALGVSRQVIVQDIAVLRAGNADIISTNLGYMMSRKDCAIRIFKVKHTDEEAEEELNIIIDCGGYVKDVFVSHKVYGIIRADMNLNSRLAASRFVNNIKNGKSTLLKNLTSDYHYHTVYAENEDVLDIIQEKLKERGFLAPLQDYEPVDFWEEAEDKG